MDSTNANYNIFLSKMWENNAGALRMELPAVDGSGKIEEVNAWLEEDFSLNLGTTWGSILPDGATAREIGQIMGYSNVVTWIQSSAAAWKSSQPLEFELVAYLLTTYEGQSPITEEAKKLMKLMALHVDEDNFATAKVHGGYKVDYAASNSSLWYTSAKDMAKLKNDENTQGELSETFSKVKSGSSTGTITIYLNNTLKLSNLLLTKVNTTLSSSYINAYTPLYIKLDLGFRSSRALLTTDIDNIFYNPKGE